MERPAHPASSPSSLSFWVLSASSEVSFCLTEKVECFSDYMTLQIPRSHVQGLRQWLAGVLRLPGKPSSLTRVSQCAAIDWLEPLLRGDRQRVPRPRAQVLPFFPGLPCPSPRRFPPGCALTPFPPLVPTWNGLLPSFTTLAVSATCR